MNLVNADLCPKLIKRKSGSQPARQLPLNLDPKQGDCLTQRRYLELQWLHQYKTGPAVAEPVFSLNSRYRCGNVPLTRRRMSQEH